MIAARKPIVIKYIDEITRHKITLPLIAFKKPVNQKEYDFVEQIFNQLIIEVQDNEDHPLTLALQIIGENLEAFDDTYFPPIGSNVSDIDLLKYIMKTNNLSQKDMIDIFGNQGNVSKFLNGERSLSKSQIARIVARFHISADFFFR